MILTKALKKEKGEPIDDIEIPMENDVEDEDEEDEENSEDDEEWEDEPTTKKQKMSKAKTTPSSKKGKPTSKSSTPKSKSAEKKEKKDSKKTPKKEVKKEGKGEKKKGPDKNLKPNLKIKVIEKDPLFETKDHVPFISKMAHTKLVFRAVLQNDVELLKQLLEDDQHVHDVKIPKSVSDERSPLQIALENNNVEMVEILLKDIKTKENKRLKQALPPLLIDALTTGTYNPMSLGVPFVRKLTASRGSREGNAAFTNEIDDPGSFNEILDKVLLKGLKKETIDSYINLAEAGGASFMKNQLMQNLELVVMRGHIDLAAAIIKEDSGGLGYNFLHKDVLTMTTEDLPATIRADSVRKKPSDQSMMTPLHCACINPNKKYIERLLSIEPDLNLEDKKGRKPIHYAACCKGTGPLEVLLKKGASPFDVTRRKCTPLFYACSAGRAENADLLLKRAKTDKGEGESSDPFIAKFGVGGIDRPNWESICPIHVATEAEDAELLKVLLKHGVNVNKPLSASKAKLTPLMIAAGKGNLEIVRLLVQNGAIIEQPDKFKRTALTHAVMNGSVPVASYLLYLGADPNHADSSGNTLVHYAAAYGWYFVLKLLVNEGGADPKICNDWKVTPVGVAFMKGHMGLVDFLLKMPGVDINFKNVTGMTLLSIACSSALEKGLDDQVAYLLKKGGDPTITDVDGFNALHHLAASKVIIDRIKNPKENKDQQNEKRMDMTVKIAELLIGAGCRPTYKTNQRQTAITLAITQVNTKLISYLVEKGGAISAEKNEQGNNSLHLLAQMCMKNDLATLVRSLNTEAPPMEIKENGLSDKMEVDGDNDKALDLRAPENNVSKPSLKKEMSKARPDYMKLMVADVNHNGYTPLLVACEQYATFKQDEKMDKEEVQTALKNGREFIKAVLDLSGANPSQTVQKKYSEGLEPEKESQKYTAYGKWSPIHFMVHACTNIKQDECAGIKLLLSYKPDLELKNLAGDTPLSLAVRLKSVCCVELLLQAKANPNVTFVVEKWQEKDVEAPVLHCAIQSLSAEIVNKLLAAGAQPDGRNSRTKRTCLHSAVSNRSDEVAVLEIMASLLKAGADVNAVDVDKQSALHLSVNSNSGSSDASTEYEELLIQKGADVYQKCSSGRMPIHYVFKKINNLEDKTAIDPIVLLSLLTRTMKDQQLDEVDCNCQSALHLAASRGATISCVHLLQKKASVDRLDKDGNTPLSFAVANRHDSCAIILIQNGANVKSNVVFAPKDKPESDKNKKALWRWKPLVIPEVAPEKKTYSIFQEAIQKELQGVAHMVLEASGNIDSRVIEAALRVNQYNVALRLLRRITDRSQLQILNEQQQNLFHVLALNTTPCVQNSLQLKVAHILFDKGVSLSKTDENGCTPLHYAALNHQQYDLAKFFVEKDTALDLNKKDKFDRTVLAAFFWDHQKVTKPSNSDLNTQWLQLFLSKGCSLDVLFDLPLPDVPVFDMLSDLVNNYFTTACEYRISPLIFAINFCEVGILRFLLENGASSNFSDNHGLTPLMHAVKKNDLVMVKILLNNSYKGGETKPNQTEKTKLSRQLSRHVFNIIEVAEDEEKDEESDEENEEENNEEDQEDEEEENVDEDESVNESADDDHDTDEVDDEQEDDEMSDEDDKITPESFPSISSLSSKQSKTEEKLSTEEFETIEKTSDVNMNAADSQGWTAVHHLVCPLEYGTFDNEEMLFVLAKVGADIQKKDNAGLSPLDHALIRGATKLARRLQMISGIDSKTMEKPVFPSIEVKDSLPVPLSVDYKADSEEYLKSIQEKDMEVEDEILAKVDYCCAYKSVGEVVMDESQKIPYDVTLSKVDVTMGTWGMYNFYKMQVVYQKAQDMYVLFTRWGRIGDKGQFQHTPFQKKSEAITEFGKIFRSKTGNYWSNVKSFEKQPKKYRLVESERTSAKPVKIDFTLQSDIPSKLPKNVQDLVKEMSSVKMMEAALTTQGLNYNLMPFGRLKREVLIEARKILTEIGGHVKKLADVQKNHTILLQDKNAQMQEHAEKIAKLSNDYYHCIPQKDFVFEKIAPISNKDSYKKQVRYLSNLLDIECAEKIVIGAQSKISNMNPLDYIYQAIGCKIQLLSEDSAESQYILKYIHASCKESHVHAIYKLSRPGEDTTIRSLNMENHKLLWHGSNMSNFISILHRGLLVSPPEIPMTGSLFGEGVYSSDAFFKCQMYACNYNPDSDTRLALLCQVALGKSCIISNLQDLDTDITDSDYNSKDVDGNMVPDKDFDVTLPYGAVMPLGQLRKKPTGDHRSFRMPYKEYIVNDSSQVCVRYLVEFSKIEPRS